MKKLIITLLISFVSIFPIYADEIKNQNIYEVGDKISVDGTYDGITFAAGADVEVNTNSLFGALAGQSINFKGITEKDLFVAGEKLEIDGTIKRDMYAAGQEIIIKGVIEGNVYVASEKIIISESANIKGNIRFYGSELENKGQIDGKITYYEDANVNGIENNETKILKNTNQVTIKDQIISAGYSLLRYLFVFMIVLFSFPKLLKYIKTKYMYDNITDYFSTSGTGIIGMFVFPLIGTLLLISNIGLSVGLIMIVLYIVMIYITTILSGYILGNLILNKMKKETNDYLAGLIGITTIMVLSYIPYLGTLVTVISTLFGFGLIVKMLTNRENRTL